MKKTLIIIRHAEALSSAPRDKERPLSESGLTAAAKIGPLLKAHDFYPEHVLCSAATRTRQTCKAAGFEAITEFQDALYNADAETLLTAAQTALYAYDCVAVIAHNPGVQMLAATLAGYGDEVGLGQLMTAYPPGTVTVLGFETPALAPEKGHLKLLETPAP